MSISRFERQVSGPSQQMQELVSAIVPKLIERVGTRNVISLSVVGSGSRGEETWKDGKLVGDVDLIAILDIPNPWRANQLQRAASELEEKLTLGCFPLYSLNRYRTLEFYEARCNAWIVWGQPDVFQRVRIREPRDIPAWEGLRLLLNRAMDCIQARAGVIPAWYGAVKTFLALGEADLVFHNQYTPSYMTRWHQLAAAGSVLGSPELLERYEWATAVKLGRECGTSLGTSHEHEHWLLDGLSKLFSLYLGQKVTASQGIDLVARQMVHLAHRGLYLFQHWRKPAQWHDVLVEDPIFALWRRGLEILEGKLHLNPTALMSLRTDFEQTLQPLPR